MSYRYITPKSESESPIVHADHAWEEWHAYLNDVPDSIPRDSTGICCHTCETVILDVDPATDY